MVNTQDVLEIKKDMLPYECTILLAGQQFTLAFNYNATADILTVDLYQDGKLICAGEPIIYGVPLWNDVYNSRSFPAVRIIPKDPSGEKNFVTFDNLCDTVLLIVDNEGLEYEHDGIVDDDAYNGGSAGESSSSGGSTGGGSKTAGLLKIKDIEGLQDALDKKLSEETDPSVSDWAKAENKPTYTAKEVGAATEESVNQLKDEKVAYSDALTLEEIEASTNLDNKIASAESAKELVDRLGYIKHVKDFIMDSNQTFEFALPIERCIYILISGHVIFSKNNGIYMLIYHDAARKVRTVPLSGDWSANIIGDVNGKVNVTTDSDSGCRGGIYMVAPTA